MTANATVSISLIFSIVSVIGVIVSIIATFRSGTEKEENKRLDIEKNFLKLNLKLDELTRTVGDAVSQSQRNATDIKKIREDLIRYDERMETLFRYKDDHEKRIKGIEVCDHENH